MANGADRTFTLALVVNDVVSAVRTGFRSHLVGGYVYRVAAGAVYFARLSDTEKTSGEASV